MADQKHLCGTCNNDFDSEQAYVEHECSDGLTPADAKHQGEDFALIQAAALRRGLDKAKGADAKRTQAAIDELGVPGPEPQ